MDIWVHGEHLLFAGRKMSKSSGNVVLLQDVIDRGFDPLALRLCFLENRYRSQMDLTWAAISGANETIKRWRGKLATWGDTTEMDVDPEIESAFKNDLDTPKALIRLRAIEKSELANKREIFLYADQVLGLKLAVGVARKELTPQMQKLLADRLQARNEKRWRESDELREQLEQLGLTIKDTPAGQIWS